MSRRDLITRLFDRALQSPRAEEGFWRQIFGDKVERFRRTGVTDWDVPASRAYYENLLLDVRALLGTGDFTGWRVMEAGCGTGILTLLMARDGAEAFLVDALDEALDCCRIVEARLRADGPFCGTVHHLRGDLLDPGLRRSLPPCDLVHNEGVVEEFALDEAVGIVTAMSELSRATVMVGVPNFFNPYLLRLWLRHGKTTETYYRRRDLADLLAAAGLREVQSVTTSFVYPTLPRRLAGGAGRRGLGFLHLGRGTVAGRAGQAGQGAAA